MAPGIKSIYLKNEESEQEQAKDCEGSSGKAGNALLLQRLSRAIRGEALKSVYILYAVHVVSFVLWFVLLTGVIAKYAEMSKALTQLQEKQGMMGANGSKMQESLAVLHFNQSAMQHKENSLKTTLDAMKQDQATLEKSLKDSLNKVVNDQAEFWAETDKLLGAIEKQNRSVCRICPDGWQRNRRSCYHFSLQLKPWSFGKQYCVDQGGFLVSINDQQEQTFLSSQLNNKRYWIGLSDMTTEDTFTWTDHSPLTYKNWAYGEPNDYGSGEDCVIMHSSGRWNDYPCSNSADGWICEKHWAC